MAMSPVPSTFSTQHWNVPHILTCEIIQEQYLVVSRQPRNLPRPLGRCRWLFQSPPKRQDDWTPSFAVQPFHIWEAQPCIIPSRFKLKMEIGSSSFTHFKSGREAFSLIHFQTPSSTPAPFICFYLFTFLNWPSEDRSPACNGYLISFPIINGNNTHRGEPLYHLLSDRPGSVSSVLMKKLHEVGAQWG